MVTGFKGIFITFEGPDGAGKTTQLGLLSQYIKQQLHLPVLVTREPGGTAISDKIRQILLDPENQAMMEETEILLYAASRAQHVKEKIIPALQQGTIVLCDRFVDASIAYQGFGLGISSNKVAEINRFATRGLQPDRTYLLDLAPEVSRERLLNRQQDEFAANLDRIEQKGLEYHRRVRSGFKAIADAASHRIKVIDADRTELDIQREIQKDFVSFFQSIQL